jgi:hypothetical protein
MFIIIRLQKVENPLKILGGYHFVYEYLTGNRCRRWSHKSNKALDVLTKDIATEYVNYFTKTQKKNYIYRIDEIETQL